MNLLDVNTDFGVNADGLFQEHSQVISQDFLDSLKSERMAKSAVRSADLERVASVPTFVWELWIRQGRDPYHASARQIVSWLERDDLQAFITTPKNV